MAMSHCSFCQRAVGEGRSEQALRAIEMIEHKLSPEALARIRQGLQNSDRKVQLLLPGPGELRICDLCIDLYAETARRELAIR